MTIQIPYIVDSNGCWLFQGGRNQKGYGIYKNQAAHRYFYEFHKGKIPANHVLDHFKALTHNCPRHCVNLEHLIPVTNTENIRRGKNIKITMFMAAKIKERAPFEELGAIACDLGLTKAAVANITSGRRWKEA